MPTLNWIGKDKVLNHHNEVPYRILEPKYCYGDSADGNMIIHGDNLEALKSLLPEFEGRVKVIYIDPPYNTGNESWVYNDNVNDPRIRKWLGEVVGKEGDDLSRHDKWLCMMYPRLRLLQKLLAHDGAIFVSIDFHEQPLLRLMMDEIFGSSNYVSEIACVNKPSGRSDDKYIATAHEYIVIYRKTDALSLGGFAAEEKNIRRYNKTDSDGRLYREEDLRKRGSHDERADRPNLYYPFFYNESTGEVVIGSNEDGTPEGFVRIEPMKSKGVEGTWRWGTETATELKSYLHPRYMPNKNQWSIFEWQYLDERGDVKPTTLWDFKDVNSERGTETFTKFLGFHKSDFPNPKPVGTIERIMRIATDRDAIVLDSFAGSGTTAHAVLNANKADGGHRRFILVEMEDYADSITAERVKRVMDGYGEGKKAVEGTGGGFSFYELGERLFLEDGTINPLVDVKEIRKYIWFTETRERYVDMAGDESERHLSGELVRERIQRGERGGHLPENGGEKCPSGDMGGKYIRPIVLFQAQPKVREDSSTFAVIKKALTDAGIPAEYIAIKTGEKDEIKDTDLLSPDCPIRYIITVNALKEGWDCPFAYILATVANRSSVVDVEQILGRILRMPYAKANASDKCEEHFLHPEVPV